MARLRLGILVSGTGTNLGAILDAVARRDLDAEVRLVISNIEQAPALERASKAGVPARAISHRGYATREEFDRALVTAFREAKVEWVVLAGFMRLLSTEFLATFAGRIINIHPALLPAFPGVNAQRRALEHGVKVSGCTVHFVDEAVDSGPIIAQRAVPVHDDDDESSLRQRILVEEHALLVQVLQALAADRVQVIARANLRPLVSVRAS
ncbi:MAG TPA: phosphoribosylglycinamide formyltransferase [Polyangiaceae bacterium]